MKCHIKSRCDPDSPDHQPFPQKDILSKNLNLNHHKLRDRLGDDDGIIYFYVMTSIIRKNGMMVQKGTGPNFQGGYISLCTCKHFMRCFKDKKNLAEYAENFRPVRIREHHENRDLRLFLPGDINYAFAKWPNIYD